MAEFPKLIRISEAAYDELTEAAADRHMRISDLASRLLRSGIDRLPEPQPLEVD